LQYAAAMSLRVIAVDSGEEKKKLCASYGAEIFLDFKVS
jgi:alcohol dehydrogenase, propanol-preferring